MASLSVLSPEERETLTNYKNSIQYYCDTLWQMCGQQNSRLQQLDKARSVCCVFEFFFYYYLFFCQKYTFLFWLT